MTVRELREKLFELDNQDCEIVLAITLNDHSRSTVAYEINGHISNGYVYPNRYAEAYGGYGARGLMSDDDGDLPEDSKDCYVLSTR